MQLNNIYHSCIVLYVVLLRQGKLYQLFSFVFGNIRFQWIMMMRGWEIVGVVITANLFPMRLLFRHNLYNISHFHISQS